MKKLFFLFSVALLPSLWKGPGMGSSFAQQDVQFTQYMFNTNAVNPGYTGSRGAISGVALFRTQWVGFEGAPVTQSVNVNSPFLNDKLGIGLTVLNEKIGPLKQTGIFTDFAYRIKFSKSTLALGLKAGADIFQAGFSNLNIINAGDNQFQTNVSSKLLPNLGFGIYFNAERYYFGFSTPKLVQNNVDVQSGSSAISQIGVHKLHYYFIGGYVQDINPFIKFRPTTQVKLTYGAPVSIDANASFMFFDKLWLSLLGMLAALTAVSFIFQVFTDWLKKKPVSRISVLIWFEWLLVFSITLAHLLVWAMQTLYENTH